MILYKNGLQRAKFLKTINFINNNFFIHHLLGAEDYRLREIAHFDSSANDRNSDKVLEIFYKEHLIQKLPIQLNFRSAIEHLIA